MSFLNPDKIELSDVQEEAIDSIDKLNMLAYSLSDGTEEEFNAELAKVKTIFKSRKIQRSDAWWQFYRRETLH